MGGGAQGGNYDTSLLGGLGGYTEGEIDLQKGDRLYVYVGGQPSSSQYNLYGGWNGGGDVPAGKDKDGRAGGGATDIRTIPTTSKTTLNSIDSLASRIMVARGGGTSFVSGCENCIAIDKNSTEKNIISTGQNRHYSNYVFYKVKMASGDESQPNPKGGY